MEEDLFTLNAAAPELLEQLPSLFEAAVKDSLRYNLDTNESRSVLASLQDIMLGDRSEVFGRLASLYGNRASPLQQSIDRGVPDSSAPSCK